MRPSELRPCLKMPKLFPLSRINLYVCMWCVVVIGLAVCAPRGGQAFFVCRGAAAGLQHESLANGAVRRLSALERVRALASRRSRCVGRGLCMDARSCAPEITDATFEAEVLDDHQPVLVFFRAPWCGPCRMVGPVVDEVIDEHGGKLKVLELCTDENPKTVAEFKIRNIPTLMLFSDGRSVMTVVGAVPKSALVSSIKKHVDL